MADALREAGFELDDAAIDGAARRAPVGRPTWRRRRSSIRPTRSGCATRASTNFSQLLVAYLIPGAPGLPPAHDADRRRRRSR